MTANRQIIMLLAVLAALPLAATLAAPRPAPALSLLSLAAVAALAAVSLYVAKEESP